jgi:tetratricopeptide (TPR) repeat protein
MDLDPTLCEAIKQRLASLEKEKILEAVNLTERFPPPGPEPADIAAQVLHDVALHAESLADWRLCVCLYSKSLAYRTVSDRIPLGSWYRRALCEERMGAYVQAVTSYRKALEKAHAWPYVAALARKRLADLLIAGEEFGEALPLLEEVWNDLPHPEITLEEVVVSYSHSLIGLGRLNDARHHLEQAIRGSVSPDVLLVSLQKLAYSYEMTGQHDAAVECYRTVLEHPASSVHAKAAASLRLETLVQQRGKKPIL